MSGHVRPEVIAPDIIGDGRGRAMVPGDFQCRSVLLVWIISKVKANCACSG